MLNAQAIEPLRPLLVKPLSLACLLLCIIFAKPWVP